MFVKHLINEGSIWKSISDKKSYRLLELANGLRALLISSPKQQTVNLKCDDVTVSTEKPRLAAAALAVRVGHFHDPFDVEGLAHLVEHTILMGNQKYPEENEFDVFLNEKSGSSNAFTDYESTIYEFEIPNHYIEESLEKFSAIFHSPLFNQSSIIKELKPVDCEFKDAISDDDCRIMQLFSSFAKEKHPLSIFSWGNSVSLIDVPEKKGLNIQEEIKKFWSQYYHAQNMSLVILAELDLDKIEEMVRKYFSTIRSCESIITKVDHFNSSVDFPYTSEFFKLYIVEPIQSGDFLRITWWLPPKFNCYQSKPLHLISMILGHEGTGSLFSYLKRSGLIFELVIGNDGSNFDSNSFQSLFLIQAKLTELGIEKLDHVVNTIFYFMNQFKIKGFEKSYFDEEQFIRLYQFQFADDISPSSYCVKLAERMFIYPLEYVLIGCKICFTYNPTLINEAFDYLVPNKANFVLLSQKSFDSRSSRIFNEKWFETNYRVENVPQQWLNISPHSDFDRIHFPLKNTFVAESFDLVPEDCDRKEYPCIIDQNQSYRLWYKRDFTFNVPKACFCFLFSSPIYRDNPLNALAMDLFVQALTLKMAEDIYPAEVAGITHTLKSCETGLNLTISGFNQKLSKFLKVLIDYILKFDIDQETFRNVQDSLASYYFNSFTDGNKLARSIRLCILQKEYWSILEKRSLIGESSKDQVIKVVKSFFSNMFIDCLIQGNISKKESLEVIKMVQDQFKPLLVKPYFPVRQTVNQLPACDSICRVLSLNREERSSILVNYYQFGHMDIRTSCLLNLLSSAMNEPIFDFLRTKEGLGYYVANDLHDTFGIGGLSIIIHSPANKYDCSLIDEKIETFLTNFSNTILNMKEEEYRELVNGIIKTKNAPMLNLRVETARNWSEIVTLKFCFNRIKQEVKLLEDVSLAEFKRWSIHNLSNIPTRKKLSIQIVGNGQKAINECFTVEKELTSATNGLLIDGLSQKNIKLLTNDIVQSYRKQQAGNSIEQTYDFKYLAPANSKSTKLKIIKNINDYKNDLIAFQC